MSAPAQKGANLDGLTGAAVAKYNKCQRGGPRIYQKCAGSSRNEAPADCFDGRGGFPYTLRLTVMKRRS
jgi:hypothetical protein